MTKPDQHFPWTYDYCPYRSTDSEGEREIPCFEIVDCEGRRVAMTDEDTPHQLQEADARLLAASPDLLDGVEYLLQLVDRNVSPDAPQAIARPRAAVTKAKGGAA